MKKHRLSAAIFILFLFAFIAGCAKGPLITKKRAEPPVRKKIEKPLDVQPSITGPPSALVVHNNIGCIFPLTGRFGNAGRRALDAAQLSLKIFKQHSSSHWGIVAADSGETPEKIREAVSYLADDVNVIAIVAMSGTNEATVIAEEAQKRKVPLILVTSKEGVTETGEYVFQHFLTATQQIDALMGYVHNTLNMGIFSVLYPQDDYGLEMVSLFRSKVNSIGGKIHQEVSYRKSDTDFSYQIKRLTGNRIEAAQQVSGSANNNHDSLSVDFEALFIPDSHQRIKMITSQLAYHNVRGVQLLGASLWHSPDLIKSGVEYLNGAVFVDSFFVNGYLPETNDFVDVYYAEYGREPGNIDALSYDTMDIVLKVLEKRNIATRDEFLEALLDVHDFRGATGSVSFNGNRVSQKDAFILTVQNGKIVQVK
ncbi:MAG: penicillin-binding protein activator [Smithellaceae bacterium]|nr:penicillin-binding protein activator [Smithellaceae bacterium]